MIAISLGFGGIWLYVVRHTDELGAGIQEDALRQSVPGFTIGGLGYVAGTLVAAFVSAVAALTIYGLLGVYYLFEHLPAPSDPNS